MCKSELHGKASDQPEDVLASASAAGTKDVEELGAAFDHINLEEPTCEPPLPTLSLPATPAQDNVLMTNLPPELMAYVFAFACHDTTPKFHTDKERNKKVTPFVLGSVCSEWRAIVWSTPAIWSHISLYLITSKYDTQVGLLKGWLARSGTLPLTINFLFQEENDWSERIPTELVELLGSSAPRWRAVNLVLPEAWYPLLAGIKHNLSLLTNLSTQSLWHDCGLPPSRRKRLELFSDAPSLRDIYLNGYYLSDIDIPWRQLTRLTLQHVYIDECFCALSRTPRLESCRIYTILYNDVNRTLEAKSIELPSLRYLHIYHSDWQDINLLLSNMNAPSLHTLEFANPLAGELPLLPSLLANMGCNLMQLKILDYTFLKNESKLVEFIRDISSLKEIQIELGKPSTGMSDFFSELLKMRAPPPDAEDEGEVYFLPQLERFSFSGFVTPQNGFENKLLYALQCRKSSAAKAGSKIVPLLSFDLKAEWRDTLAEPTDELKEQFQALVRDGLELDIVFEGTSWL